MSTRGTPQTGVDFLSFPDQIAKYAAADPTGMAFTEAGNSLTWKTLSERVNQVGRVLAAAGIRAGDKVAILAHPSLDYVECLFGSIAARACVVPLAVSASVESLQAMLDDSGAKFLFADSALDPAQQDLARRFAARVPDGLVWLGGVLAGGPAFPAWRASGAGMGVLPPAAPEDPFNIIYSSGTTGMPKGIVHLHDMRQRQARRPGFGLERSSRTLLSTPLYSNTTIMPMLATLAHGGTSILMRKFDAGRYLAIATAMGVTHTMLVPVQYKRILAHVDFNASDLSAFVLKQSTGAPMEAALKREILDRWPGRFVEVYGMTEGGCTCVLDARLHPEKLATVGMPAPGNEVFILDEAGHKLPRGATGEVVGRSPFMMAGYHNRPDATAEIRWHDEHGRMHHRTGDIGRFDDDGFLILLDRKKDVIISGGNNIYAADLEAVLAQHPDVYESAVIGIPSADWGETPLALVVPRAGSSIDAAALREWVNARVGKTQRLHGVELRAELPRSNLGKISKKQLRTPYWEPVGGAGGERAALDETVQETTQEAA